MKGKGEMNTYWLERSDFNPLVNESALERLDAEAKSLLAKTSFQTKMGLEELQKERQARLAILKGQASLLSLPSLSAWGGRPSRMSLSRQSSAPASGTKRNGLMRRKRRRISSLTNSVWDSSKRGTRVAEKSDGEKTATKGPIAPGIYCSEHAGQESTPSKKKQKLDGAEGNMKTLFEIVDRCKRADDVQYAPSKMLERVDLTPGYTRD